MGIVCGGRYRLKKQRSTRYYHNHHNKHSIWRNPIVVFIITFAALGSLRWRVPARSKEVASNLLIKHLEKQKLKKELKAKAKAKSLSTSTNTGPLISTKQQQEQVDIIKTTTDSSLTDTNSARTTEEKQVQQNQSNNNNNKSEQVENVMTIDYELIEEEKKSGFNKKAYRKYKVFDTTKRGSNDNKGYYISVYDWANTIINDTSFVLLTNFINIIKSSPYDAIYFETPSITLKTIKQQEFEFVLVDAPGLHRAASNNPDRYAFADKFNSNNNNNQSGIVFTNLGGDATLIVPTPPQQQQQNVELKSYSHLLNFVRNAPIQQVIDVWNITIQTYINEINNNEPIWFSTCGTGVYWLHFRLDTYPKYYSYTPYKKQQYYTNTSR